jgi:hypothetical protein
MNDADLPSSFRDPSGSLFVRGGVLYRRVNAVYRDDYDCLLRCGLYSALVEAQLLVAHEEIAPTPRESSECYRVIRPEAIPFISYPYEWCFSQLKDAALTTLRIQQLALDHGMGLKDASAYNIQFRRGKPVLIDTLSFERYRAGRPWVAYRQFCEHFLAPLALMARTDVRLSHLLRIYIDGVPLDLAGRLLPWRTRLDPQLWIHLHLHARMQARFGGKAVDLRGRQMSERALRGFIAALRSAVKRLSWRPRGTKWANYYDQTSYSAAAAEDKRRLVAEFIGLARPEVVWDLGANVGAYSRIASDQGICTVAFDVDPAAVEKNYLECRRNGEASLLPLVLDLTNPSGDAGWANEERQSLAARGPADLVMALALVHHLAIANNVPFKMTARFLARLGRALVIEFAPKDDAQVQRLLASREDVFADYHQPAFERGFERFFTIERRERIADSDRVLYLMRAKASAA